MRRWLAAAAAALMLTAPALAQRQQAPTATAEPAAPTADDLARDGNLFIRLAATAMQWEAPTEPVRIAGPLYYVGTKGLGAFLLTTPEGHILINSGMPGSGPMIAGSIRKLGFRPEDIRILLANHGHIDHVGSHADLKALSGAKVMIMAEDAAAVESGGRSDFFYGRFERFHFSPVTVDRKLAHNDLISLGGIALRAVRMAGHSPGATSFLANVRDGDRILSLLFVDGTGINPGYRLVVNPTYPDIAGDYRRTFHFLEAQQPDIWLSAHADEFGFAEKRNRAPDDAAAFENLEGYRAWVAEKRAVLDAKIRAELAAGRTDDPAQSAQ